ncbi:MAG: DUF59 domain-containing protein [Alphaproteobacteria bacterium]
MGDDVCVKVGTPLAADAPAVDEVDVIDALRSVYDPEIPVNIYDLGLIYDIRCAEGGVVSIQMTLTAPACPVAGTLPREVALAVAAIEGAGEVDVTLCWDPPWTPDRMSDVARVALDMF